jgi:polar amino acid transport system substrate-binding protein
MKTSRRGRLWVLLGTLALVSVVALVAAGCGSSSPSSTASSTPPIGSASSAATVTVAGVAIKADPALHQLLPASILSAGQIRIATDIPVPPWEMFVGDTTTPTGFEIDLFKAMGAELGVRAAFLNMSWASCLLSLQGGKGDMVMGDMTDTIEREKVFTFVDYALDADSILVAKGNPQGITNLDSLAGKIVTVLSASSEQAALASLNAKFKASGKEQMQIISLPSAPACLLAIESGRAVAELANHTTSVYSAKTTNGGNTFEVLIDPAAPEGYTPLPVATAILKTNTQLVTAVQKAIQELMNNGVYTALANKYGILTVKSAQINAAGQAASASPTP